MARRKPSIERAEHLERQSALLALGGVEASAPERLDLDGARLEELRRLAGARCECEGECGEPHTYNRLPPAQRCRAPQGSSIVRKKDSPGFWQLAPSTTSGPLAYPEAFATTMVEVTILPVVFPKEERPRCFCQRCRAAVLRLELADG